MKVWLAMAATILLAGCAAGGQTSKLASDAAVYRSGTFKKSVLDMTACTAYGMHVAEPDMYFNLGQDGDWFTVLGGPDRDETRAIWRIAARSAGADSSEVELRNIGGAVPSELDEVWKVVRFC